MAYAMTKQGSLDNCVTYEFICDTIADMNAIENRYRSIGSVAIVLQGESEGLEVYIAGSDKNWNSLSSAGADSSTTGGLSIYICGQDEVDELTGLPDVEEPDETSIYLVPAGETSGNLYEEYIYVDEAWEKFGSASIDLSNYIQKTDIATQSTAGLVKVLDNGNVTFNENNQLVLTLAGTAVVKSGQSDHPISVTHQHEAAFYGLAKAAGQDMKNSGNAVGTYTTEAASAIRTMIGAGTYSKPVGGIPANDLAETYLTQHQDISGLYTKPASGIPASDLAAGVIPDTSIYAPKASPVFTGSISLGRKANTTVGDNSFAVGNDVEATGVYSHAEGSGTKAKSNLSHAEGYSTTADGICAHAEGYGTKVTNNYAHAEGNNTQATGSSSHAEGDNTTASGTYSHTEGNTTTASGLASHAEGDHATASGYYSHAEGYYTVAAGRNSHVSGKYNQVDSYNNWPEWEANTSYQVGDKVKKTTTGPIPTLNTYICKTANNDATFDSSHWDTYYEMNYAEIVGNGATDNARSNARALDWDGNEYLKGDLYVGCNADSTGGTKVATTAQLGDYAPIASPEFTGTVSLDRVANSTVGEKSVALGRQVTASGDYSFAEGNYTTASGSGAHAEGQSTVASAYNAHAEGLQTKARGNYSHAEGKWDTGNQTTTYDNTTYYYGASGAASHSEGANTIAHGDASHAEGSDTKAIGSQSHAEGIGTTASGMHSHAEGAGAIASNAQSHAEGAGTTASGLQSHAEGNETTASGMQSHAEGTNSNAINVSTHAEGAGTTASGAYSHAEGVSTIAGGSCSHAEGASAKAYGDYSHAEGAGVVALGAFSHVQGQNTISAGSNQHIIGKFNQIEAIPTWISSTEYEVGDLVSREETLSDNITYTRIYRCKTTNSDATFNSSKWEGSGLYAEIVGNGTSDNARSNARALDWDGNEHLKGDIYINCNPDSTGGTALGALVSGYESRIAALEAEIESLRVALTALVIDTEVVLENGHPLTDEQGNLIEYDTPTT